MGFLLSCLISALKLTFNSHSLLENNFFLIFFKKNIKTNVNMQMIDSHGWKINHLFQRPYELFNNKGPAKLFSTL